MLALILKYFVLTHMEMFCIIMLMLLLLWHGILTIGFLYQVWSSICLISLTPKIIGVSRIWIVEIVLAKYAGGGLTVAGNLRILQWQVSKKKHNKLEFLIPWWDFQVGVSINQFLSIFASSNSDFRFIIYFFMKKVCSIDTDVMFVIT